MKKGPTKARVVVEPEVAVGRVGNLVALGKRHPSARLGLIVTVVVLGGLVAAGLVAPSSERSQMSAADLMTASIDALAGAKYVSFSALGSGAYLPGPMVYEHSGTSYELTFDVANTIGGAQVLVVNGTPYIKGDATYWKNSKVVAGAWYRWPRGRVVSKDLSGPATLAKLGIVPGGVAKGAVSTIDGRKVIALHYLYSTLYVPLSGNIAPLGLVIADPSQADLSISFSYAKTVLKGPAALAAPASVRSYFSARTENGGWYQSVGNLLSVIPEFLGSAVAKK